MSAQYVGGVALGLVGILALLYFRPKNKLLLAGGLLASGGVAAVSAYQLQGDVKLALTNAVGSAGGVFGLSQRDQVIMKARSMLGAGEMSPEIQRIITDYQTHWKWPLQDRNPTMDWCAAWALWIIRGVAGNQVLWWGTASQLAGQAAAKPAAKGDRVGSVAIKAGHVGLVVAEDGDNITTIEGNRSNSVMEHAGKVGEWTSFWRWW